MGANTTWVVFGYKLVEHELEVSALTYTDALEEAEKEGLLNPYDAQQGTLWDVKWGEGEVKE